LALVCHSFNSTRFRYNLDIIKKHNNLQTYEEAYSKLLEYYNNQVMLLILGRVISYISENTISLYNMIKNEQI